MILADPLVFNAVHQRQALRPVDHPADQINEGLRIALEVHETTALGQNAHKAPPGELSPVLEIGQQIGKCDISFLDGDRS